MKKVFSKWFKMCLPVCGGLRYLAAFLPFIFYCQFVAAAADNRKSADAVVNDTKSVTVSIPIFSQTVVFKLPQGWNRGYEHTTRDHYIIEFVPSGQSVDRWKEIITVQGFKDFSRKATPQSFLNSVSNHHQRVCGDKMIFVPRGDKKIDSYPAYAAVIGCTSVPANLPVGTKRGQSEVAYYIAIAGQNDLYVIDRGVRREEFGSSAPSTIPDETEEGMRQIAPIKICDRDLPQTQCWQRPPR